MLKNNSLIISWGKFLIGWPISLISLGFIIKLIFDKAGELNISEANINFFYLVLGLLTFFVYFLMRSFLWRLELSEKGYKINFRENTYRFSFSEIKRYTPGNIWSFLSRGYQFAQLGVDKRTLGISLLADIQLVIIGCTFASLFAISWLLNSPDGLKLKLFSLLPVSLIAIAIFFITTGLIYTKRYNTLTLHSAKVFTISNLFLPGFELNSKIKLSALSVITYFIFGIGNFFVMLSIFQVGFDLFLSLSSFFVFSLLIGFLSFITPTGLGVREVIITLGLSMITSLSFAGIISIYTRVILIASELLFLIIIFIWQKSQQKI